MLQVLFLSYQKDSTRYVLIGLYNHEIILYGSCLHQLPIVTPILFDIRVDSTMLIIMSQYQVHIGILQPLRCHMFF